jgi:hypothetical protein
MEQLELPTTTVLVDGMRDPKHADIQYWGRATLGWDGKWRCYANVQGAMCVVEVSIRFEAQ